jgi:hypothetical protein
MVDTTIAAVCEDPVTFTIQTATYMMATDGNIDGSPIQITVLARNADHAKIHHPMLYQEHSRLCQYSKLFTCQEHELDREIIVKDQQDRNHRS